ncbi:ParA family protein [uncultured Dokdonia sp.]|uniref:ParA family protein n=1 Tax=uncultured Dokdonia sp. TaxID=575653 RepID=UPI0030EC0EB5
MTKIISIIHQKGGCGKTTLLSNLSMSINSSASVAIVDLDYQGSIKSLEAQFPTIPVYPADTSIADLRNMSYDFLLVDTPPYMFDRLQDLAKVSDVIITPIKPSPLDLIALSTTMELLSKVVDKEKILVVLNMVKPNTTLTDSIAKEVKKLEIDLAKTRISDLVDFTRSIMNKGSVTRKAQAQINAITKEILIKLL